MPARFCVLASGSSGNCTFVQSDQFGLLIDVGLGPRVIASRLAAIGASWRQVHAVVLTHTHSDHWKELTLGHLRQMRIPMYCSLRHGESLSRAGGNFAALAGAGLVRPLLENERLELSVGMTCRPVPVPHDSDPTFAFRIDGPPGLYGPQWSIGYAADLGEVRPNLVDAFVDVSVLALEFNHCVRMQQASGRPRILIDRVLGDSGHLSNEQAADAVRAIIRGSAPATLRHLVQLHLSRECNRQALAAEHGRAALADMASTAVLTTAQQFRSSRIIALDGETRRPPRITSAANAAD